MSKKKPLAFLDVSIDGDPAERMVFELFSDFAPKTAENFRALCTGEKASSKTGRPLHYKGTFFHRIAKGSVAQAGDLLRQDGNYGESIYGGKFPDESPKLKHDSPGLLSMAIADRDARGSIFSVTFQADHHLDRKSVVFGKLVDGIEVLKKIENVGNEEGKPDVTVKIVNCGELPDDKRKPNKLKNGKHKKSSKERRKKRRRYYTSESESSTDSDTESSDSDSDSESDTSSESELSSSSDDRRRKRKRSKRERHRRAKRKEKRRERRRKRHDKKSKRKSKRTLDSLSESESGSESSFDDDGVRRCSDGKHKNMEKKTEGNHSASVEEGEAVSLHHRKEAADIFDGEEGEFPKENGDQSNNIKVENRSEKTDRQPDVVDDHPGKSRSRSISPKRSMSRSMSISPRRSSSRSRSLSPKRSVSRSPSVRSRRSVSRSPSRSGSPHRVSQKRSSSVVKSGSSSPARSISRSPVKGKRGVSVSPPVRAHSRRRSSRSPPASPRMRITPSPPRTSSRKSWKSKSRSPVRSYRSPGRSPVRPSRRSPSRSPVKSSRRSESRSSGRVPSRLRPAGRSPSRSPVRSSRQSVSRSSGRVPSRRSPSQSPGRVPSRNNRRSYSRSPVSVGRRARSPVYDRRRSSSKSSSVDGSPKRIRRGRGFSERYSYVRRYRSRSPDRSPVRPYRYGHSECESRYSRYRRSPRRYRSPPRGRTPPRYRGRRSRSRSLSRSPIRYRARRYSRSPMPSRSPVDRYRRSPSAERRKLPSPSRSSSRSESRSSPGSQSPKPVGRDKSRSSSASPPGKGGLVSYGDGSPDSG